MIVDHLFEIYPTLRQKSIVCLSVPGLGKTPLGMSVLMALSRDSGDVQGPYFRMTSELDFLRGEPGCYGRGDLFDDGDTSAQQVRSLKAFLDVSLLEAAIWARWGGIRLAKGQPRIVCDNKVDMRVESKLADDVCTVSHQWFLDLIKPMFPDKVTASDIDAILKRAHFFVQTKQWLYVRKASESDGDITRTKLSHGDAKWISPNSRYIYGQFLEGDTGVPEDFDSKLAWERAWVQASMHGENKPAPFYGRAPTVRSTQQPIDTVERSFVLEYTPHWESKFENGCEALEAKFGTDHFIEVETKCGRTIGMLTNPVFLRSHFPLTVRLFTETPAPRNASSSDRHTNGSTARRFEESVPKRVKLEFDVLPPVGPVATEPIDLDSD